MTGTGGDEEREAALEQLRRQSGIRVGGDGELTYQGRPIENDRVVELFLRGLDVRADGAVTLTAGRFWCYPEVASTARFVRGWRADAEGGVAVLLGGREVALAGAAIGYAPDDRFYVWLQGERGPARVLRAAHQALAGIAADDPDGVGRAIGELAEIPSAGSPRPPELRAWAGLHARAEGATPDDA